MLQILRSPEGEASLGPPPRGVPVMRSARAVADGRENIAPVAETMGHSC